MIVCWTTSFWLLWRQQGSQLLPVLIRYFSSSHASNYRHVERFCKHALVFDRVFATVLAHEVGHATLFFIAGLLILLSFPRLRRRPALYLVIMALGAISEEALQDLFKLSLPSIWDGRDLLLDLTGCVVAYVVMCACSWGKALLEKEERS